MRNIRHSRGNNANFLAKPVLTILPLIILCFQSTAIYAQTSLITGVTATSGRTYTVANLITNTTIYSDRTYQATSVPSFLNNAPLIKTPNDDKTSNSTSLLSFNLSQSATVYVAYDPRATVLPAWLSGWQKSSSQVGVNDPKISAMNLYSKTYAIGKVTLGGNLASPAAGALNNYFVAAVAQTAPSISVSPSNIYDNNVSGTAGVKRTVTIKNTGAGVLSLSSINTSGTNTNQFALSGLPTFPRSISAGASISFSIAFNPTSTGLKTAAISIKSNDPAKPTVSVPVRALGTAGLGGANEPSLQSIVNLLQIQLNAGDDDLSTNIIHSNTTTQKAAILGDEISVQKFQRAGSGNVTITPLCVFGPTFVNPVLGFGWYKSGNAGSKTEMFTVSNSPLSNAQTVNVNLTGTLTFNPGTSAFGFFTRWPYFSNRLVYSEDNLNTFTGAAPHHVRVYLYKKNGVVVPNSYVVAFEEDIKKLDYQDLVFVVSNVKKFTSAVAEPNAVSLRSTSAGNQPVYIAEHPRVSPNPLNNKNVNIEFPAKYKGNFSLELVDMAGKKYQLGQAKLTGETNYIKKDISGFAVKPGVYFLRIVSADNKADIIKLLIE